ncbi:MAG: DinB family protein [Syntrophomonadaceae bacterium]|nr:DinB family protein [Syntrophomonadaceae bacterium]
MKNLLIEQLEIAWKLFEYHTENLSDTECYHKQSEKSLCVFNDNGKLRGDFPETESYEIGLPTIAWVLWHIIFWWSSAINYSFADGSLTKDDVFYPGTVNAAVEKITALKTEWVKGIMSMTDKDLLSSERAKFPFADRPFYEIAAWLNLELMKNAAEIGAARFVYNSSDKR